MPGPNRRLGPRPQIKKGVFGRLLKTVFGYYGPQLTVVMICLLIAAVSQISMSVFMQKLIDECITPGIENGWDAVAKGTLELISVLACIYLLGVVCSFVYTRIMAVVCQGSLKRFRDAMFDKMQTLPIKYFDTHAHGDIMSTYTNDTDAVRQLIGQSLPSLFSSIIMIVGLMVVMLSYSIWLFLMVILAIFIIGRAGAHFGGKSGKYMVGRQQSLAKEEGFVEEMMTGLKVVKVFTHEEDAKKDFDKLNDKLYDDSMLADMNGNVLGPITNNVGNIFYVIIAIFGALLYGLGVVNVTIVGIVPLTLGIVVTFLGMFGHLSQMVGQISQQITMVMMGIAGAGRVFELIDEKPEEDNGYCELVNVKKDENGNLVETKESTNLWAWKHPHQEQGTVTYTELKGEIELENVDFGYVPDKLVLEDVSLHARAGEKFAFVGATGAGKTTITNLINRFYDIPDGKIRFDGININKIKKPDLRRSLGLVLQDVNLFTGTVMDNIRYGRLDATDEECIEAAKLANAHDFITRLPEGYNTMLTGNGASLSQGQRQLLSIARAAVANTPAMILDEATSSIDTRTEALVQNGMDRLMEGRTVFVIAHRLSTVRNAKSIIVLDHGHIIERGSHDELIKKKGVYYQLYTGAFEME
ncbi:MAG: ABC transporter ATP-binding protein/permease [Lachnospiraceae bacterium]|nr:ABC transporter ATP-binding protein/permease [Lachnospiraceae bacterium]